MTEENYNYRTSQTLLRNQFPGKGKLQIPIIPRFKAKEDDFNDLLLIGFDKTHLEDQKEWFLAGCNEMLRRIEPEKIICYNTPFPEMSGDIVYVDYERSSWRYMDYERKTVHNDDLDCYKIGGAKQNIYDTIDVYMIGKGGGSAYGGEWKPSKPEDERLVGKPGEIKVTYKKDGTKVETKIGEDGRAVSERHHTEHSPNGVHSNPHDHKINWSTPRYGIPNFSKPINYWGDVPDFKYYQGVYSVKNYYNSFEDNRFKTISDFKESMICGGEVVFEWDHKKYGAFRMENDQGIYCISLENGQNMKWCNTLDDLLEYYVGPDRLRDVITQVTVIDRTL